jgi:hypothetical protein
MYSLEQDFAPVGGTAGWSSGLVCDGSRGHTFGGQSGLGSLKLAHNGRFNPSTQMQVQAAWLLLM